MNRATRGNARQMKRFRKQAQRQFRASQKAQGIIKGSHPTRPNRTSPYETVEQEGQARTDAVIEQARLIREQLPTLLKELSQIPDPRKPLLVRHKLTTLMLYGILMFVLQTGSRRKSNEKLSAPAMKEALMALFPDLESIPHHDTLYRLLAAIEPEGIEEAQVALVRDLIRDKKFSDHLVQSCYLIAIDGTQKMVRRLLPDDAWLQREVGAEGKKRTQYYVYVLEANLVLSNGVSIPLMSEFLNYGKGDSEREKQDCEQRAFFRLAKRLKQAFPHLRIMLLLDGLFANGPVMDRCRDYRWHFMIVLQDGSLPQVWQEYQGLKKVLEAELHQQGLWRLFEEVEMPLIPVLVDMETTGVSLDTELLQSLSNSIGQDLLRLEKDIYNSLGHQFNINSSQQLSKILFEELNLPKPRKNKSGFSTDAAVLEGLKGAHPVIELILQYRQLSKLKSTYTDAFLSLVNPRTGRLHTIFNQTGTTTGRLSSSEPNLQNLPIRTELGGKIRQAIIARPGWTLLSADYSQIDLRALAHISQDPALIETFLNDEDVHTHTASLIFNVADEAVNTEMRRVAKTVNFGVIYGMSDYGLEQATSLSREEAGTFIKAYFEKYPGVKKYIETTKQQAQESGYVQTVMGRRRYIPEIYSPNRQIKEAAERMAINMPVQGTSADIIKIAMINIYRELKKQNLKSKMLLQVHDELIFEVPPGEVELMKQLVSDLMRHALKLAVPLKVEVRPGKNWGELK